MPSFSYKEIKKALGRITGHSDVCKPMHAAEIVINENLNLYHNRISIILRFGSMCSMIGIQKWKENTLFKRNTVDLIVVKGERCKRNMYPQKRFLET